MSNVSERILFIAEVEAWGGAERSFLTLCDWLHRHSLPYRLVVYWDRIGLEKFATHPLNKVELLPGNNPLSKVRTLRKYFASQPESPYRPLMSGYQPALHASLAGLRGFHCMMHDTESLFSDWDQRRSWKRLARLALNRHLLRRGLGSGGQTIVASDFLRQDTERLYGATATVLRIGSAADGIVFRQRPVKKQLRMLSISRLEANKRIDWVLRSLSTLEQRSPALSQQIDWRLDVVGKGAERERLQAVSRDLGIESRVTFSGFVSDQQLSALYDEAHLFLMPARQGYGIPALEALHSGIPVLLHRESGISDILLDTPWAHVFEGTSENLIPALEGAIQSLVAGTHLQVPPPHLPTQDGWAEEMARLCRWI
jgi:glycosyltransferase involved in cell wall biosynthesis